MRKRLVLVGLAGASLALGCGDSKSGQTDSPRGSDGGAGHGGASGAGGFAGVSEPGTGGAGGRSNSGGVGGASNAGGTSPGGGASGAGAPGRAGTSGNGATSGSSPSAGGAEPGVGGADSGAGGDEAAGASGAAGEAPDRGGDLFTNPLVPHCDDGTGENYELRGTLGGASIDLKTSLFSTLDPNTFQVLQIDGAAVVEPLVLTWTATPSEDTPMALTGTSITVPLAGQSYCVTSGTFGTPALAQGDPHPRKLLFHITGLRLGDCSGPPVAADLGGCFSRTTNYLPTPDWVAIFPVDPSRPDLPADAHITDLTDDEQAELCDWMALEQGGYDNVTECFGPDGESTKTYDDQAQCLTVLRAAACPSDTVGGVVVCTLALAPTRGCYSPTDECDHVLGCLH